jgi:Zn-dependent protease
MDSFTLIAWFLSFIIGISIHECAHAFMAYKLGDMTAKDLGRVSLNPLKHIDPVGTLLLPLIGLLSGHSLFGWAKPTPFNPNNLQETKKDELLIAIAGPASNLLLAGLVALMIHGLGFVIGLSGIYHSFPDAINLLFGFLYILIVQNLTLAFFNMLPIPPLDGSTFLKIFLPEKFSTELAYFNRFGFIILVFASRTPLGDVIGSYLNSCVDYCLKIAGLFIS